jgi:hypothetical protein
LVEALCYKPEGRGFEPDKVNDFLLISLILPVTLGPGICSFSRRLEYQGPKYQMFLGSRACQVREADRTLNSVRRLSKKYGILSISQPYRTPRPVTEVDFIYFFSLQELVASMFMAEE